MISNAQEYEKAQEELHQSWHPQDDRAFARRAGQIQRKENPLNPRNPRLSYQLGYAVSNEMSYDTPFHPSYMRFAVATASCRARSPAASMLKYLFDLPPRFRVASENQDAR
jgi:hypothetical protein